MKVSAINCVHPVHNYKNVRGKNVQAPNFRGVGGAVGVIGGTAVGIGLTMLTGGATLALIPLIGWGGGVTGEAVKENLNNRK